MPSRTALVSLTAAAALGATASAATAAPPWSDPQVVADSAVRAPALAFGTGSEGVATLGFGESATRILSLRAGGPGPVAASRDVGSVERGPLPYASTRTIALRRRSAGGAFVRLGYSFGRQSGAVGTERTLRTVRLRPNEAELAVSPGGMAVIAFAEERGGSTRVWLATRRAGSSRFSTPRVVRGSGSARSLAVSVNDRGRYVLAYALGAGRTRVVEARVGTVGGSPGRLHEVGGQLGLASVAAVVARTGRTTVAWATHDGGEEQNEPTQLRANVVPAGRSTFAGQVVVDRGQPSAVLTEPSPPSLAAAPDGTTAVGYTLSGRFTPAGGGDALTPARVSVQDAAARFAAPQELSADGVVGTVAARADGTFAVAYVTGAPLEGGASPLFVALRPEGASAFGTGELVATGADEDAAVAFAPGAAGEPVVLFTRARATGAAIARRSA